MRTTTWIALALTLGLAAAGCGSDPADADGADDLLPSGAESAQFALDAGRADLELTASATPITNGTAELTLEFALLDKQSLFDPTVTFDLPPGVTTPTPPDGCEPADQQLVCTLTDFYTTEPAGPGEPPGGPLQLTVTLQVDNGTEEPTVTLTATSRSNNLNTDPDSTNNVVELTLTTDPGHPTTTPTSLASGDSPTTTEPTSDS